MHINKSRKRKGFKVKQVKAHAGSSALGGIRRAFMINIVKKLSSADDAPRTRLSNLTE